MALLPLRYPEESFSTGVGFVYDWISLPFVCTTSRIILLAMYTYIKCHGRSSPSSPQTLTTHIGKAWDSLAKSAIFDI